MKMFMDFHITSMSKSLPFYSYFLSSNRRWDKVETTREVCGKETIENDSLNDGDSSNMVSQLHEVHMASSSDEVIEMQTE